MFFIGIFGIDKKNEELRALYDTECGECSGKSCTLYKEYYRFHFFFIPLFTWGRKYRIVCESCGSVYSVQEEKNAIPHGTWAVRSTGEGGSGHLLLRKTAVPFPVMKILSAVTPAAALNAALK